MSILLYRNYFYPGSGAGEALGHFSLLVITSAVGYGLAALVTPAATRRLRQAGLDRGPAGRRRGVHRRAGRDVQPDAVPRHRVRAGPGRAGRSHLRLRRSCSSRWTTPTAAGCSPSTTCSSTSRSCRGGGLRAVHARERQVCYPMLAVARRGLPAGRGRLPAAERSAAGAVPGVRGARRRIRRAELPPALARPSAAVPEWPARGPSGPRSMRSSSRNAVAPGRPAGPGRMPRIRMISLPSRSGRSLASSSSSASAAIRRSRSS